MDTKTFEQKYRDLKFLIEKIDPAGFGAADEYDDVLFKIVRQNAQVKEKGVFATNVAKIIGKEFGLGYESLSSPCNKFAEQVFSLYPQGI